MIGFGGDRSVRFRQRRGDVVAREDKIAVAAGIGIEAIFGDGAIGDIAGAINPVSKNKRSYWTGGKQGDDAQAWFASATETPGSWWNHWIKWVSPKAGEAVAARRKLGSKQHPVIEPAPGRYVKIKASQPT